MKCQVEGTPVDFDRRLRIQLDIGPGIVIGPDLDEGETAPPYPMEIRVAVTPVNM